MANDFFKNGDKVYAENLNDSVLVGNAFDWTLTISLPSDTSVFPNSSDVVKAKVCDVSITPNSNLSIGSTISNSSGSSQVYRLTVYPDFNRFGGFKSISLDADSGVTFYIANKGGTSPIANNLDYTDLSSVPELKVLKEYDIVITIPSGEEVEELSFVLQSSNADVSGSIAQSNVTGLSSSLANKVNTSDIADNLTTDDSAKVLSAKQGKVLNDYKVDKVTGKQLSSNDFTDAYKSTLDNNTWVLVHSVNYDSNCKIYINQGLRLVEFKYTDTLVISTTDPITISPLTNGVIKPSGSGTMHIKPIMPINLTSNNNTLIASMHTDGTMTVRTSLTGTKSLDFTAMWHY